MITAFVIVLLSIWGGSFLVLGVLWLRDSRVNPQDEADIAFLRAEYGPQLVAEELRESTGGDGLATEADALLWGFEPAWCAEERIDLIRAYWRERA